MPDKRGKLTQDDLKALADRLTELAPNPKCQFCGEIRMELSDTIVFLRSFDLSIGYPVLPVSCPKCGATYLFKTQALNVLPPYEEWKDDLAPAE